MFDEYTWAHDESTLKPALSRHSKRRPKLVFKTDYRLMQVKSIAECSKGLWFVYFEWPLKTGFTVCIDRCTCILKLLLTLFGLAGVKKYERLSNTSQHSLVYPIAHN